MIQYAGMGAGDFRWQAGQEADRKIRLLWRSAAVLVGLAVLSALLPSPEARQICAVLFYASLAAGIPWLRRIQGIPFAGRVLLPLISLTGIRLEGSDFRSSAALLAVLPLYWFALGALLDFVLRPRAGWRGRAGQVAATVFYAGMAGRLTGPWQLGNAGPFLIGAIAVGLALWWIWKSSSRSGDARTQDLIAAVLGERGVHLASRFAAIVIIGYPALIFLNQLDAGEKLRWEAADTALVGTGEARWFWMPRGKLLAQEDIARLEMFLYPEQDAGKRADIDQAIRDVQARPMDAGAAERLRGLAPMKLAPEQAVLFLGLAPVGYLDPQATTDGRLAVGILTDKPLLGAAELKSISQTAADTVMAKTRMGQVVVLFYILLSLLVLWNRAHMTPVAFWLAVYLCGAVAGWAENSLPYFFRSVEFVIWQYYGQSALAPVFYGWISLLQGLSSLLLLLNKYGISLAVLWTLICWPARPGRAVKTRWDHFWVQVPKVALVAAALWFIPLLAAMSDGWFGGMGYAIFGTLILLPVALVIVGGRLHRSRAAFSPVPWLAAPLAWAFILQREAGNIWAFERVYLGTEGSWVGWLGVLAVGVAFFLVVREMDRGRFLEIPTSNGLAWIIILGSLPFIFAKIGNPVAGLLASTGLFSESGSELLGIGCGVLLLDPIKDWLKRTLNRLTIPCLKKLEGDAKDALQAIIKTPQQPDQAIETFGRFLKNNGLLRYSLWQNTGEGRLWLIDREGTAFETPHRSISELLEEKLAEHPSPLTVATASRDLDFVLVREEFRSFAASLDSQVVMPVTVSGVLLGLLALPRDFGQPALLRDAASDVIEHLAREVMPIAALSNKSSGSDKAAPVQSL